MRARNTETSVAKPRILLVEDEAILREHLAARLSDEYVVGTAANGREALRAVLKDIPAMIVTDIVMPEIDGIELLKALRSTRRTQMIPVLLISGRALDEQRIEGFREGADGYLAKPYTERELRARIQGIIHSACLRNEAIRLETLVEVEKQANRRKSEFLAVLAHELRNPLAPLRNGLQILKGQFRADPTVSQTVNMMDRQITLWCAWWTISLT
jgi:DNA-binding response OmpR family regulator